MILLLNLIRSGSFKLLLLMSMIFVASATNDIALAKQKHSAPQSRPSARSSPLLVKEWFAFGSGCKASSKLGSDNLQVWQGLGDSLKAKLELDKFILNIPAGGSGVRECAVRLTVEPLPGFRVKDIGARSNLQAKKVDSVQFRSRILLLIGDRLLALQEWNLSSNEFARYRDHELYLVPGLKAEMSVPLLPCGKAQIVGLDFTFEGVTHALKTPTEMPQEDSFLRMRPGSSTELEVFLEKCH